MDKLLPLRKMGLQELLDLANRQSRKEIALETQQMIQLRKILQSYAEEILEPGQVLEEGFVKLTKSQSGAVLITIK